MITVYEEWFKTSVKNNWKAVIFLELFRKRIAAAMETVFVVDFSAALAGLLAQAIVVSILSTRGQSCFISFLAFSNDNSMMSFLVVRLKMLKCSSPLESYLQNVLWVMNEKILSNFYFYYNKWWILDVLYSVSQKKRNRISTLKNSHKLFLLL